MEMAVAGLAEAGLAEAAEGVGAAGWAAEVVVVVEMVEEDSVAVVMVAVGWAAVEEEVEVGGLVEVVAAAVVAAAEDWAAVEMAVVDWVEERVEGSVVDLGAAV